MLASAYLTYLQWPFKVKLFWQSMTTEDPFVKGKNLRWDAGNIENRSPLYNFESRIFYYDAITQPVRSNFLCTDSINMTATFKHADQACMVTRPSIGAQSIKRDSGHDKKCLRLCLRFSISLCQLILGCWGLEGVSFCLIANDVKAHEVVNAMSTEFTTWSAFTSMSTPLNVILTSRSFGYVSIVMKGSSNEFV